MDNDDLASTNDEVQVTKKEKIQLLLFSLLAAVSFDYLFYDELIGISYPIFVILLLGSFWWNTRHRFALNRQSLPLLGVILLLSATFALYSNPVLETINYLLIPLLIVTYTLVSTKRSFKWWGISTLVDIIKRCGPLSILNFAKPFLIMSQDFKPVQQGTSSKAVKSILIGLLVSVPILLLVVPLLSSADMVFRSYVTNLTKTWDLVNFKSFIVQSIIIFAVFIYVFAYVWSFYFKHSHNQSKELSFSFTWDSTVIMTVLSTINMVYLIFSIIQFSYLYGVGGNLLPAEFTYAEYARRGFWELVAVTIINLSILLGCMKFVRQDNKTGYLVCRILLGLLIVFSLNMLFSAHFKMSLYENVYGLTYLRVFVHYFMGLLLVFFLLAFGNITLARLHLVKAFIVVSLVFYTVLNYINVDHIIVQHNLKMYSETGKVDISYIQGLSGDTIPVLVDYIKNNNSPAASQIRGYLSAKEAEVKGTVSWKSFNHARYKARASLSNYK